jgi:hypothetical protein
MREEEGESTLSEGYEAGEISVGEKYEGVCEGGV